MDNAFKLVGVQLIEKKGISVIPVAPNSKVPSYCNMSGWYPMSNWQMFNSRLPIRQEYEWWATMPNSNIGIVLGTFNKIIALDFDYFDDLTSKIYNKLPISPLRKRGEKGFTAFYKYNNEKSQKWLKDGKTVVELLSNGRQTVIPPSIHINGNPYKWLDGADLLKFDLNSLPELPANYQQIIEEVIGIKKEVSLQNATHENCSDIVEEIKQALKFIPANDYELWIKIGMSLKSYDNNIGLSLWDDWSKSDSKYPGGKAIKSKWNSFNKTNSGFNLESVFFEAYSRGFKVDKKSSIKLSLDPSFYETNDKIERPILRLSSDKTVKKIKPLPLDITLSAPGLAGKIVSYILESSIYPQPELALASTLAFLGGLKGQRVRTETDLRTNNYIIGIAPAGSGKDHALTCIQKLCLDCNLKELFGGKPVSDSGLLKMLEKTARKLVFWDEIGLALKEIVDTKSQGYKKSILTLMMELFSSANKVYFGKEYSNKDGSSPRVDIVNPCLCLYGVTTPMHFYESLNLGMISDGFISRFLVFEISKNFPKENKDIKLNRFEVPEDIKEEIRAINNCLMPENEMDFKPDLITVKLSADARKLLENIREDYYTKKVEAFEVQEGMQSLWARGVEHILKIALTVQTGSEISYSDLFWSYQVVNHCIEQLQESLQSNLVESDFGKKMQIVKDIFEKAQKSTLSIKEVEKKLYYRIGRKRDQEEIINALIATGELVRTEKNLKLVS